MFDDPNQTGYYADSSAAQDSGEPNLNNLNLASESDEIPSLDDVAEPLRQGAWPDGWYPAAILEGYASQRGTQFNTEDIISKNGDSRNLRLCFQLTNPAGETRNLQENLNYRPDYFTPQMISGVKEARSAYKEVRGAWPGEARSLQAASLTLGRFGQLEKALGFRFKRNGDGNLLPGIFPGHKLEVRITTDENSFNKIVEFAKVGEKVGKVKSRNK